MINMVFKMWMAAAFATMSISYGLHSANEMRQAVLWFFHKDGQDQSTKP